MIRGNPFVRIATPTLVLLAGCFLDSKPIAVKDLEGSSASAGSLAPADETLPTQVTTGSAGHDSAAPAPADATALDAGAPPATKPPPAATVMSDAATPPPTAPSTSEDAGSTQPPVARCDGLGSYGLRATLDVTWDATAWSDVGRGNVELYGLVKVDSVDPNTHAVTGSFRACGLTLPTMNSSALCSSYQLQIPEATWDSKLPEQKLDGTYVCDAERCTLKLSPASYALGIQLKDPLGPWPAFKDTMPSQFTDDDADGFPGISLDVVSGASLPSSQSACTPTSPTVPSTQGPAAPSNQGPSNQGPGKQGPGNQGPGNQWPTTTPVVPTEVGQLLLGMRTQLTAALQLSSTCEPEESSASGASIGLRSAGCFVTDGLDPDAAALGCSEELRSSYDETLPRYEVLEQGKAPKGAGATRREPSAGTLLKAVRIAPGSQASCEEARRITL